MGFRLTWITILVMVKKYGTITSCIFINNVEINPTILSTEIFFNTIFLIQLINIILWVQTKSKLKLPLSIQTDVLFTLTLFPWDRIWDWILQRLVAIQKPHFKSTSNFLKHHSFINSCKLSSHFEIVGTGQSYGGPILCYVANFLMEYIAMDTKLLPNMSSMWISDRLVSL